MRIASELRMFHLVVGSILLIPLVAGNAAAWGGLEGMATLFGEDRHAELAPAIRNHLRAITWMFVLLVPLVIWTLRDLEARAGAFRIVVGFGAAAGIVRLTGRFVDGDPGVIATAITGIELVVLPLVLVWHTRLIRLSRA